MVCLTTLKKVYELSLFSAKSFNIWTLDVDVLAKKKGGVEIDYVFFFLSKSKSILFSVLLFLQDLSIKFCDQTDNIKPGSRGAARAAKSLRWSV